MDRVAAVVLAGGRGTRFGGVDKPGAAVGGVSMLARVLAATTGCSPRIVVGPSRAGLPPDVRCVREEPPGGGPVAALAAALPLVDTDLVVLLAGDLPFLTASAVETLIAFGRRRGDEALLADGQQGGKLLPDGQQGGKLLADADGQRDGALLVDADGRRQLLCGAWRVQALREALRRLGDPAGQSVRRLVGALDVVEVQVSGRVWLDVDTPQDLERAEKAMMADDGPDNVRGTGARGLDQ